MLLLQLKIKYTVPMVYVLNYMLASMYHTTAVRTQSRKQYIPLTNPIHIHVKEASHYSRFRYTNRINWGSYRRTAQAIMRARNFLEKLDFRKIGTTCWYQDNISTIRLIGHKGNTGRMKHIALRYDWFENRFD